MSRTLREDRADGDISSLLATGYIGQQAKGTSGWYTYQECGVNTRNIEANTRRCDDRDDSSVKL